MNGFRRDVLRRGWAWLAVLAVGVGMSCSLAARAEDAAPSAPGVVRVVTDASGSKLQVDGRDFFVRGMNWDYIPIGQNYMFDLWSQPDDVIQAALEREMPLMRAMGINAIRQYSGLPPRWVQYIHDRYGIWTILNHPVGRYGFTLDGVWHPVTDYSDPTMRAALKADVLAQVERYKGTPGVLMWLLGNENNYGLSWSSFEIEALPKGERDTARAKFLYSLFGEIIVATKAADPAKPVAIANGDLQYIDLIAEECKGLDVMGTNVYRGISVGDMYQVVHDKLGVPLMFSEFGCDAFNARTNREDQAMQARYLLGQWREIEEQSAGHGGVGNAIGGCIFQWSDGWWKYGQDSRLDVHDTHASWPDGGYVEDFVQGENNMNEEWWGLCAKGPADDRGLYELYPRAAYYALQRAFTLDPYAPGADRAAIDAHFAAIEPAAALLQARGDRATAQSADAQRLRVSGMRMNLETIATGGKNVTTPLAPARQDATPQFLGYDKLQEAFVDFEGHPSDNVTGTLSMNILTQVPGNPINEIFYEKRVLRDETRRIAVHHASMSWDDRFFTLDAFYHTGHYHWGYEGDFFGLYREANYGTNTDVYDSYAPIGFEAAGKRMFEGLKFAYGQELWWGANPAIMAKYRRALGRMTVTGVWQEDVSTQTSTSGTSSTVPTDVTRKGTLTVEHTRGPLGLTVGGIWANGNKLGQSFMFVDGSGPSARVKFDHVYKSDAFGAKAKVTYQRGKLNWYAQAARMGLVADAGPTQALTYTGWSLKDVGSGNQTNVISGVLVNQGKWAIAPNVLWQKPIIGPISKSSPSPAVGRNVNVLHDPFAVRANREMTGAELLIGWDPTPATWMWAWDNDVREDAPLAASLDFVYRHMPTTMDRGTYIQSDGVTSAVFDSATVARDLWEVRTRFVSRIGTKARLVATAFVGDGESNGDDQRVLHRFGADLRLGWKPVLVTGSAHFNDWGPYDYHRDFNLTFPAQYSGDVAYVLGSPRWLSTTPQTSVGVRGIYRTLDSHSNRWYTVDGSNARGNEWEFRSYLNFAL